MSADAASPASTELGLLRACVSEASVRFLRFLLCLCERPHFQLATKCIAVGQLSSDVTSGICASILRYLKALRVRNYESVSGLLLEEMVEASGRLVDIPGFIEEMLWDDIGMVGGEEYRAHLCERLGYIREGERSMSSQIGN